MSLGEEIPAHAGRPDQITATRTMEFCGAVHTLRVSEVDDRRLALALERLAGAPEVGATGARAADPPGCLLKATLYVRDLEARARVRARLAAIAGRAASVELTVGAPASGAAAAIFEWRVAGPGVAPGDGHAGGPGARRIPGVIEQPGVAWQFTAVDSVRRAGETVAEQFHAAIASASARLDTTAAASTLLRTWIYIGNINGRTGEIDNYQAVNHARRAAFAEMKLPRLGGSADPSYPLSSSPTSPLAYPASTGIGTATDLLSLGLLAFHDRGGVRAIALENPQQTSAFAYPRSASAIAPLFSRAVALCARNEAMVLISGTASIVGARSVHLASAARQTEQSLANVGELLEPRLLAGRGFRARSGGLPALRGCVVYVKRAADVAAVRAVCDRHLPPGVPTVFALADICRPELLVEIEGIALLPAEVAP